MRCRNYFSFLFLAFSILAPASGFHGTGGHLVGRGAREQVACRVIPSVRGPHLEGRCRQFRKTRLHAPTGFGSILRPRDHVPRFVRSPVGLASSSFDKIPQVVDPSGERNGGMSDREGAIDKALSSDQLFYLCTSFEFALAAFSGALGSWLQVSALGAGFDLSPSTIAAGCLWTLVPLGFNGSMRLLDLRGMRNVHQVSTEFVQRLFVKRSVAQLALFCFAAGFGEELLFRGIVQQQLELLVGISPAAIAVAVGFGLGHSVTSAYFVLSALSSLIFSLMFVSSGNNIVVPVLAHGIYDFLAIQYILFEIAQEKAKGEEELFGEKQA